MTVATQEVVSKGYKRPNYGVFRFLPNSWIPYAELMRLDRLSGFWAFYWHYLIGLGYVINLPPVSHDIDPKTLIFLAAYLSLWTTIFRGITCTWNDNLDQDYDRQVARCQFRPIARHAVASSEAHLFTAAQIAIGALVLSPCQRSVLIHAAVNGVLLFVYPLLKRFTDFPQVELGFGLSYAIFTVAAILEKDPLNPLWDSTSNFLSRVQIVMGSPLARSSICLYAAGILWCIIFDTVYAHQDYEVDLKAGVKGLAVRLGRNGTKPALFLAASIQVYFLVLTGQFAGFGTRYYAISCAGAAVMLIAMLWTVKLRDNTSCAWWFGPGSACVGALVTIGLFAEFFAKKQDYR
ncbi:UbiA prenyltransferase family [Annulohypoxylon nitens]|nr:UbiA prenyltransferase family [Annulohypoxylon nitens]